MCIFFIKINLLNVNVHEIHFVNVFICIVAPIYFIIHELGIYRSLFTNKKCDYKNDHE